MPNYFNYQNLTVIIVMFTSRQGCFSSGLCRADFLYQVAKKVPDPVTFLWKLNYSKLILNESK